MNKVYYMWCVYMCTCVHAHLAVVQVFIHFCSSLCVLVHTHIQYNIYMYMYSHDASVTHNCKLLEVTKQLTCMKHVCHTCNSLNIMDNCKTVYSMGAYSIRVHVFVDVGGYNQL